MKLVLTVAALATLFICSRPALACSCLGTPSVCGAFELAEAVFVGTVTRVENQTARDEDGQENIVGQVAYVQVDEAFKGVKASELIFRSYNTSCDTRYEAGERRLFYANYGKEDKAWAIGGCGRSTLLQGAGDDLLYLRGLPGSAQKTRIAGELWNRANEKPLAGVKVKLIGERATHEVFSDTNGVYEIYDLPAGKYIIKPETPLNLKLDMSLRAGTVARAELGREQVDLIEKSCAGIDFYFTENTVIKGTVYSVNGQPMPDVCVRLMLKDKPKETPYISDCTDENGRFKIDDIGLGEYFLIANDDNVITSDEPFPLTYYPGVLEKEKATILTIASGDKLQDFDIHIPSQRPTRTIEGRLLFSDGRPVDDGSVEFASEEKPGQDQDRVFVTTDAEGRFKLSVLEGSQGTLHGSLLHLSRDYANCPKINQLVKAYKDLETNRVNVEMSRDYQNIELIFPFPYCAKSKERE
jgi:hypothetical protein